jgi:UPF0716 family protein affecting phage T7 exclusion
MKEKLMLMAGIIIVLLPGGLTALIIVAILFPKQRRKIFNYIKEQKGEFKMAMQKIIGKVTADDKKYIMKVDAGQIDASRIESADKAFAYVEGKHQERMTTFTPALMVGMFGIGAALITTLWILSDVFPLVG